MKGFSALLMTLIQRPKHLLQNRVAGARRIAPDSLFFFSNNQVQAEK